jgi:hypothetical protein
MEAPSIWLGAPQCGLSAKGSCTLKKALLERRQLTYRKLARKVPTSPVTNHNIDRSCRGMATVEDCAAHPAALC